MLENATNVAEVVSSPAGLPSLDTARNWILYLGGLIAAVLVAFAGIRKALKDIKGDGKNPGGPATGPHVQGIVGGVILETHTILMWSESNRALAESLDAMTKTVESACRSIDYNTDTNRAVSEDLVELKHQIERLRDKLP